MALVGDIKTTLTALLPQLDAKSDRAFLDKALEHYRTTRQDLDALATANDNQPIHPQYLAQQISHYATEDAIFTCDVGTPTVWAARYLQMNGKRRLLGSLTMAQWLTPCRKQLVPKQPPLTDKSWPCAATVVSPC